MRRFLLSSCLLILCFRAFSGTFYVATDGKDTNPGTLKEPFLTIQRAQQAVQPGDTVYIRGGLYQMQPGQIALQKSIWAYVTTLDKSGQPGKRINYWAYPGERPVFNYSAIKPDGLRVIAFYVTASYLHIRGIEITGVQVTIQTHTQSECFENRGSHNIYEQLKMHDGMAIGFYLVTGSDNLILNCDAYNNWDSVSEGGAGGNTDGFGCHPKSETDTGNIFRGCRAWFNSDDGFDLIHAFAATTFDSCWSFYNGYSAGFVRHADGNGFKAGGYSASPIDELPDSIPRNTIEFCLSVKNHSSGFYANHHPGGNNWYSNTAYGNGVNFNMVNRKTPSPDDYLPPGGGYNYDLDVPGYGHVMRNNLSYDANNGHDTLNIDPVKSDIRDNSFTLPVAVTEGDFISLDESQLTRPRKADGSLPDIAFMHLKEGSPLIDAGADIGFPYTGGAPDLGCFESPYRRIARRQQTITFDTLPPQKPETGKLELHAIASSGLPVIYSIDDTTVATIAGNEILFHTEGTALVTASQPGDSTWLAAETVSRVLEISAPKSEQTLQFAPIADHYLGEKNFALYATASSGLPVTYRSDNPSVVTMNGAVVHIVGVGPVTITATQAGGTAWLPATASQSFQVKALDKPSYSRLITPNGDGINDKFMISHVGAYPDNKLDVFDEAGKLIYHKRRYDNSWNGHINGRQLTKGTYYFTFRSEGAVKIKGSFSLLN